MSAVYIQVFFIFDFFMQANNTVLGHFGHGHFGLGCFGLDISATDFSAMENAEGGRFGPLP